MIKMNRRQMLMSGAAAGFVAAAPQAVWAEAPQQGLLRPTAYRFKLGNFEITTLFDGVNGIPSIHPIFGEDQTAEAVAALLQENFLPPKRFEIGYTPVLLNTGSELVLFDTGNGDERGPGVGGLVDRLAELDIEPEQIDVVVLTHFHPDHIGGMTTFGDPSFPNARYVASRAEFDFWNANKDIRGDGYKSLLQSRVFDFADNMTFVEDGQDVMTGITAVAAFGHTPGHTAFHIESEGARLMLTGDMANHFVVSLQKPKWHLRFDMDKEMASATRQRLFDMLAADRIPFAGYHMPFPAVGYVEPKGDAYRYEAASYQFNL